MMHDDQLLAAQPRAMHALDALLNAGRAHALLLAGTAGTGTHAAARYLAQRVLCPNGGSDDCSVCRRIVRGVHPDVHEIRPEGRGLSIDHARDVVDVVTRMPFEADAQVVVLDAADSLSSDNAHAGNSLLKALEEPVGRVVFVLLAERPARVLPTIRSRSIEVPFPPITEARLIALLQADGLSDEHALAATGLDLRSLARAARGDALRARDLAAGDVAAQRRSDMCTGMQVIADGAQVPSTLAQRIAVRANAAGESASAAAAVEFDAMLERMSAAEQRSFRAKSNEDGIEKRTARRVRSARTRETRACLDDLAAWWRDVLAVANGAPELVENADRLRSIEHVAQSAGGARAVAAIDAIDESVVRLDLNNADEPVVLGALATELAALSGGRMRARRMLGAPARTPAGYDLA